MTRIDPPARPFAALDVAEIGTPGVDGRWQPTRAGVVNSWAWAEETLFFADGWLALAGPNGSGKSLTASMLITVLLDAETTQTALSVSGKASGTLTSRHTDRNEREDRTGVWWLEYGLRDKTTGQVEYLTTGLWLRSAGSTLHRAFFISPGRVGHELALQHDRETVRITELAEQLAAVDGALFSSSDKLRSQASASLHSVGDERDFRKAVRTRLFSPLDDVQFDALIGVLRSLRSVRTAEAISPAKMREVLTEALPALEPDQLTLIAQTMERIAELENQLDRARTEARLLSDTHRLYRRYLSALAQFQAAELSSANTAFDKQTEKARQAAEALSSARDDKQSADERLDGTRDLASQLEGELTAANAILRDHAGAELPLREQRAAELADAATAAEDRAEQAAKAAQAATDRAQEAAEETQRAQHHLANLVEGLRRDSGAVGAESAYDRILATLSDLAVAGTQSSHGSLDLDVLSGTPLAWTDTRRAQIREVENALIEHGAAQQAEQALGDARRRADDAEARARDGLEAAAQRRQGAETLLLDQLASWSDTLHRIDRPNLEDGPLAREASGGRFPVEELERWLAAAVASARDRIDLVGRRHQAATDAALATSAAQDAADARTLHAEALTAANAADDHVQEVRARTDDEAEADEELRARAISDHADERSAVEADVTAARDRLSGAEQAAVRAAREWLADAHRWRDAWRFLDPLAIDLPGPPASIAADRLTVLDPGNIWLAAHHAHSTAATALHDQVAAARDTVQRAAERIDELEAELAEARRAAAVPAPPAWRTRRPADGTPLWALVDFAPHVSPQEADRLEGALLVSGILDALITADGRLAAGDLVLTADAPAAGRTLADLLRPEHHPNVPTDRITQILRAVPVDAARTGPVNGTLVNGVLTASCPPDYRAAFIGRTARERERRRRITVLEQRLTVLESELVAARARLEAREADVAAAAAERDAIPSSTELMDARQRTTQLTADLATSERLAAERLARAESTLHEAITALERRAGQRSARLAKVQDEWRYAVRAAKTADAIAERRERKAEERAEAARNSDAAHAEAARAQDEADAERSRFPDVVLTGVRTAQNEEDDAERDLTRARTDVITASEQHTQATEAVKAALRLLNRAASLPDGSLLPTSRDALGEHAEAVSSLRKSVHGCTAVAQRCIDLLGRARNDQRSAAELRDGTVKAAESATDARRAATSALAGVQKMREMHGSEYTRLLQDRDATDDRLKNARVLIETLLKQREGAAARESAAQSTLDGIAPQRAAAEQHRDLCLRRLGRLIDERLAALPDDLPADPSGRPANLTAGLTWARRLLTDKPAGAERLNTLTQNRHRTLTALEKSIRTASTALARFNRQIILVSIEGTEWRRAVIADPDATRGEDLDQALQALHGTIAQLEADLRDDVKQTMKTGMFTKLRRDIQVRRQAAHELVRQIRHTLRGVRTGVANVGVQVAWDVREDEDARRMVDLISQKPSDETFDQMYTVLRQRMDESVGEPWPDRVAHTFDYRAWHEWDISVTHSSFGDGTAEVFKRVSPRSNPLESLSTGERRLATMLPLLAAAWSMYSGDSYRGPRLLSIDEIDAAFDEPNLRQILALLRMWDFDVLATTPSIAPMIKGEARRAMVHEVIASGRQRITVPWLWEGHGDPQPLTLDLDTPS
ncbi:SbcC/MukB-like Walker B domain-containing protein [Spirillospora sp. NPDC029432]|uniref:SbcC/MukB-like Walker B domain-containing protein n=1 Tax=Spirillospora sp. NPDC029432 TaxID=3154599 RepID=UPI003452F3A6